MCALLFEVNNELITAYKAAGISISRERSLSSTPAKIRINDPEVYKRPQEEFFQSPAEFLP